MTCRTTGFRNQSGTTISLSYGFVALTIVVVFVLASTIILTARVASQESELEAKKRDLEAKMHAMGKVVYAIKDVPEGSIISSDSLEEKELEQSRIPQDAMSHCSLVTGRVAKYGISMGQIVSRHDLAPQGIDLARTHITLYGADSRNLRKIAKRYSYAEEELALQWLRERMARESASID